MKLHAFLLVAFLGLSAAVFADVLAAYESASEVTMEGDVHQPYGQPPSFWCDDLDDDPGEYTHFDGGNGQVEVIGEPEPQHGGYGDDACLVSHTWVGYSEEEE